MEYNIETIRTLADKYFAGTTTLAEESILRDYFKGQKNVPTDLRPCALMLGFFEGAATAKSSQKVRRQPQSRTIRPLFATLIPVAAALLVGVFVMINNRPAPQQEGLICYVNGQQITDPREANEYAHNAIALINSGLQKPAEYLSAKSNKIHTMSRVEEMLNTLSTQ
jgi:hypothetical protein